MKVKLLRPMIFIDAGEILDVPEGTVQKWLKEDPPRAELVPDRHAAKLVPAKQSQERMTPVTATAAKKPIRPGRRRLTPDT